MTSTVNPPTSLEVSKDRTRFWLNTETNCAVRFSLVSGYEVYKPDGSMAAVRAGSTSLSQFVQFATIVNDIYPLAIPENIISEFSAKCAEG